MRAIMIDPYECSIHEIDFDDNNDHLDTFYKLLNCSLVEVLSFADFDLWLDEEGYLKDEIVTFNINRDGYVYKIAGKAICLSTDYEEGESIALDDKITVEYLKEIISF
jgi:hypothetical protein